MKALLLPLAALALLAAPLHAQAWTPRGGYPDDLRKEPATDASAESDTAPSTKAAPAARAAAAPRPVPSRATSGRMVLEVDNGRVRLNGRAVESAELPASLNALAAWPNALGQRFVFSGTSASTVEINGVRYRIGPGGLTVDTDLTNVPDAVVSFLNDRGQTTLPFGARSLILVNETAPYAAEQEYALEVSTFELATRIRALPDGPARDDAAHLLQQHLRELFEFKQGQRARELDALARELDTLRQQHAARSRNREAIVRQRMHELLSQ